MRKGERERERRRGKRENHHCIVDHYSKNEQLGKKKGINLYVKPKKRGRKMFVAHDINILTLDVIVVVVK
jgi:hypothetical protein